MEIDDWDILVGQTLGRYRLEKILGEGAYAVTFKALDTVIGIYRAIKILKGPTTDEAWIDEARKAAKVRNCPYVVQPIDILRDDIELNEGVYKARAIVWEYIDDNAITLKKFFEMSPNITGDLILEVCRQICIAIKAIQDAELEHGDLHEGNIMLIPPPEYDVRGRHLIKIVDFGLAASLRGFRSSDIESLGKIINRFWELSKEYEGEMILGDKRFILSLPSLISQIFDQNPERGLCDPVEILHRVESIGDDSSIDSEIRSRKLENPFQYLSVEEIPEESDLISYLYTDSLPWYKSVLSFGTIIISGIRGCGKSMVLKNMRLKTKLMSDVKRENISEEEFLGFYLHCNHSLNIPFGGKNIEYSSMNMDMILHYFNLVYSLEIVDSLRLYENIMKSKFSEIGKKNVYDYITSFFEKDSILIENMNILDHLKTLLEREAKLVEHYMVIKRPVKKFTGVRYLKDLCSVLEQNISLFNDKKIYFLLDDYSTARGINEYIQKSLNRVIGIRNDRFCFKITTERFAFIPVDKDNNILAQDREYRYYDLSQRFLTYTEKDVEKRFIKTLLNRRLKRAGIERDVEYFYGVYIPPDIDIGRSLGNKKTRKDTLYAGFNIICKLCSGDISTLLELCYAIYQEAKTKYKIPENKKENIPFDLQNEIITQFSRHRFALIKGMPDMGDELYSIAYAMGTISLTYLTEYGSVLDHTSGKERYQEIIRINIRGTKKLSREAKQIYEALIKYGIFTDAGTGYLWGDKITNLRLIFRKIYVPAFKISYRDRQALIMTPSLFENFLKDPEHFVREGTKFLRELKQIQTTLFDVFDISKKDEEDEQI